jgi:hypothetical protein
MQMASQNSSTRLNRREQMSTPTLEDRKDIQSKADSIVATLKSDPSAQAAAKADPMGYLTSHGLPNDAARELLTAVAKASGNADVSGYDYYIDTDIYLNGWYQLTERDWYDDWGNFLYEVDFVK